MGLCPSVYQQFFYILSFFGDVLLRDQTQSPWLDWVSVPLAVSNTISDITSTKRVLLNDSNHVIWHTVHTNIVFSSTK